MSEEKEPELLQISVAGTTIMLKETEAALVVYVDCKHYKKKVTFAASDIGFRETVQINNRAGVCAAVFPRIPMKGKISARGEYEIGMFYDLDYSIPSRTGEDVRGLMERGYISIFAGNVAEVTVD